MEAIPAAGPSLLGILFQVVRLSVLLIQNRVHLYSLLLLKIILFNHWVSGMVQEAQGSCSRQVYLPPEGAVCRMGQVFCAGLQLIERIVWLVLWVPRLLWDNVLGFAGASGLSAWYLDAWEKLSLSFASWMDLLVSCLHRLILVALLLLLLVWRLCQMAHRVSLGQLFIKNLLENCVVRELLALLKSLYWWVESTAALTSWCLAYLVTWSTCLASRLLQAAFVHTAQMAQEAELHEASWTLPESSFLESLTPEAGSALLEPEIPAE